MYVTWFIIFFSFSKKTFTVQSKCYLIQTTVVHRSIIWSVDLSTDGCFWVSSFKTQWTEQKEEKVLGSEVGGVEESLAGNTGILHGTHVHYCLPQILTRLPWLLQWRDFSFSSALGSRGPRPAFLWATREAALETGLCSWVASCAGAAKGRRRCLINWLGVLEGVQEFGCGRERRGRTASQLSLDLLLNHKCQLDIYIFWKKKKSESGASKCKSQWHNTLVMRMVVRVLPCGC